VKLIISLAIGLTAINVGAKTSKDALLCALADIETRNNSKLVGKLGEKSKYQIRELTWKTLTKLPFNAKNTQSLVADRVAYKYIEEISTFYQKHTKRVPSPKEIYVMWNAGPNYYKIRGFNYSKVNRSVKDPAERFSNLYYHYLKGIN
jgi:hypothetical protein